MKVAVLGASGRAGSAIAQELVRRGHQVLAIARDATAIKPGPGITPLSGNASDSAGLAECIRGADAVISALHFDVTADLLLSALRQAGIGRLLVTGGAASLRTADGARLIDSPDFPDEWKPSALGGIKFLEALYHEQTIDWTFFSPAAIIFEGQRTGAYRLGEDHLLTDDAGESRISFADYAIAMVDELDHGRHSRRRFTAAY